MDTMLVPSYNYRFQIGRPLTINIPSNTLHVSNVGLGPIYLLRVPFEKIGRLTGKKKSKYIDVKLLKVESDRQSLLI